MGMCEDGIFHSSPSGPGAGVPGAAATIGGMKLRAFFTLAAAVALGWLAWLAGGWQGLLLAGSGLIMWALLHFNRVVAVMRRTAQQPIGYVGSAVMLNARLKPGQPLLHVLALTQALGERLSPEGAEPQTYRWQDPGLSSVTAEFAQGRLVRWQLQRPPAPDDAPANALADSASAPGQPPDAPAA